MRITLQNMQRGVTGMHSVTEDGMKAATQTTTSRVQRAGRTICNGILAALICATPCAFGGNIFSDAGGAGAEGSFGVVSGVTFQTNNGSLIATVGIESNTKIQATGPGTISGVVYGSTTAQTNSSISNTTVTNAPYVNAPLMSSVATSISQLATWASTSTTNAGSCGQTVDLSNVSSQITLAAKNGCAVTVFNAANVNINNGGGQIKIDGSANPTGVVIINVSGTFKSQESTGGSSVFATALSGGITSDQILWNLTGNAGQNNFQTSGNHAENVLYGDFLDLAGNVNINEVTVNGRIFGGNSDGNADGSTGMSIVSNAYLNAPASYVATPEPSTWLLVASGALVLGLLHRHRKVSA